MSSTRIPESSVLSTEGLGEGLISSNYKLQALNWNFSDITLHFHWRKNVWESLTKWVLQGGKGNLAQTQGVQTLKTLTSAWPHACSCGVLFVREQWIHTKQNWEIKTETETESKAESDLGALRISGQAATQWSWRERPCLPHLDPGVKISFSKEALKRCLSINLSVVRGLSAAINHSRSQTGPLWRCP